MARARLAAWAVVAVIGMASTGASAALCGGGSALGGFDDVQDTNNFCNSALWMKNRGVTLGCTAALYCPGDVVSRASMALFMNRLGVAMTPRLVSNHGGMGGAPVAIMPGDFIPYCETSTTDVPAANFPRTLRARGTISAQMSGSEVGMALYYRTSTPGQPHTGSFQVMGTATQELRVAVPSGDEVLHWSSRTVGIQPGTIATVAIGLINRGPSNPLTVQANGRCAIELDVVNANPASPPFDEQQ